MRDEYTTEADVPAAAENGEAAAAGTDDLQAQLDAATARADENYNKYLYAVAEFENYRKRAQRESESRVTAARKRVIEHFLPVLDNLERALAYQGEDVPAVRDGLQQTLKGFEALLAMEGVKAISVKGEPFDPAVAEAIATQETQDADDGVVLEEAQKGYTIGDELLRPAKVIVAKRA